MILSPTQTVRDEAKSDGTLFITLGVGLSIWLMWQQAWWLIAETAFLIPIGFLLRKQKIVGIYLALFTFLAIGAYNLTLIVRKGFNIKTAICLLTFVGAWQYR
ncbi:MAG: hypothetical protein QM755_00230 [Luteolibacter sp.]